MIWETLAKMTTTHWLHNTGSHHTHRESCTLNVVNLHPSQKTDQLSVSHFHVTSWCSDLSRERNNSAEIPVGLFYQRVLTTAKQLPDTQQTNCDILKLAVRFAKISGAKMVLVWRWRPTIANGPDPTGHLRSFQRLAPADAVLLWEWRCWSNKSP